VEKRRGHGRCLFSTCPLLEHVDAGHYDIVKGLLQDCGAQLLVTTVFCDNALTLAISRNANTPETIKWLDLVLPAGGRVAALMINTPGTANICSPGISALQRWAALGLIDKGGGDYPSPDVWNTVLDRFLSNGAQLHRAHGVDVHLGIYQCPPRSATHALISALFQPGREETRQARTEMANRFPLAQDMNGNSEEHENHYLHYLYSRTELDPGEMTLYPSKRSPATSMPHGGQNMSNGRLSAGLYSS
jgi:hypothetical protein